MKIYLLSIKELREEAEAGNRADAQALCEKCLRKMDVHRREKVYKLKAENARYLAIGAGVLLQLAWADCVDEQIGKMQDDKPQEKKTQERKTPKMVVLNLSDLLQRLTSERFPMEIPYQYGGQGKPDFAEGDFHFNLSHSGDYVCCAVDKKQIGIDIQKMRPLRNLKVAERFVTIREQEALKVCPEKQALERLFYDIWVKKEAYAKLTGEGIGTGVAVDTTENAIWQGQIALWQQIQAPEGYCMGVCSFEK